MSTPRRRALALAAPLIMLSCSWAAAQEFKVGYSAAGLIDDLQITWSESIRQAVESAGGEVLIVDSQNKNAKQLSDIEDLLVQDIDVLVINPVDEAGIITAVEAANQAGVPVITIDRASAGGEVAVHVEFDNYKAGYEAGRFIAEQADGKGEVAQLEGQAGTSVARVRGDGFRDAIKEYPNMTIVMERPTDWSTSAGLAATEDLLQSHPEVVGIWTHADAIAMGAVEALNAAGRKDVIVVGMGMYAGGPESIRDGGLTASWELYPAKLGDVAGAAAVALARGEPTEKVIHTEITFVTKDNIADFLK